MTPDARDAAQFIDWARRAQAGCRVGTVTRDTTVGWVSGRPGIACGEFPSSPGNRIYWQAPSRTITDTDITEALDATRALGGDRTFIWLAPWASDDHTQHALADAGATRWPHVEYIALAREADTHAATPSPFTIRALTGPALDAALQHIAPWYSAEGVAGAAKVARDGIAEVFFAFEADTPIAMGLLFTRAPWAYLGAAGTDPAHRNRGIQKALIRARVSRAAELGASWCVCETNTAVPVSLTNLIKCGFAPIISWHVYSWTDPHTRPNL